MRMSHIPMPYDDLPQRVESAFEGGSIAAYEVVYDRRVLDQVGTFAAVGMETRFTMLAQARTTQCLDEFLARAMKGEPITPEDAGRKAQTKGAVMAAYELYLEGPNAAIAWMVSVGRFQLLQRVLLLAGRRGDYCFLDAEAAAAASASSTSSPAATPTSASQTSGTEITPPSGSRGWSWRRLLGGR